MLYNAYGEQALRVGGVSLVSCGHIFAENGREICRPKGREDWLLFFVAAGSETFFFSREQTAPAGSFVLYAPGEPQHHICRSDKPSEFYYIHIEGQPEHMPFDTRRIYTTDLGGQVAEMFSYIIEETLQKQPCYERLCLHKFWELMALLERSVVHRDHPQGIYFERIAPALQHINRNYAADFTLSQYAEMCNMSKFHFLRVFRQVTGCSPLEYRSRIRLAHAVELLEEGRLSVREVGESVGFSSPAYFSDAFKRKMGISPAKYKKSDQ